MSNGTSDIIIKGGSAEVHFDDGIYEQDPTDPNKYSNEDKKVMRVLITGDLSFDSGNKTEGWHCEITVHCE
ncbi:MAG: hypothetical protein ABR568_00035 [Pyrinomonadaceae bacterium]